MRALDGPDAALASLFSVPGVLIAGTDVPSDAGRSALTATLDHVPAAPATLDTPPPRS